MRKFVLVLFMGAVCTINAQKSGVPEKLTKLAISQLVFATVGALDYAIKEAPMYPNHRDDSFFWQTTWAGIAYGTSFSVNLLAVKEPKYLLGALTEDMSYYLCRKIFHKENFPEQFGLPVKLFGRDELPMKTVVIVWAASLVYLTLDALEII